MEAPEPWAARSAGRGGAGHSPSPAWFSDQRQPSSPARLTHLSLDQFLARSGARATGRRPGTTLTLRYVQVDISLSRALGLFELPYYGH